MTDKAIWSKGVIQQRYRGPERRAQPRESVTDAVKAFLVLLLLVAASFALALTVYSYAGMYS